MTTAPDRDASRPGSPAAEVPDLSDLLTIDDPHAIVRAYVANPAFRAAEWHELTCENNPFRRPVRPDDLDWLDYSVPLPEAEVLRLSALLGHRMLRNVHDADRAFLPAEVDEANHADRAALYSTRNRVLGELARPILERHLFSLLDDGRAEAPSDLDGLAGAVADELERRLADPGATPAVAARTTNRTESTSFLLLQLSGFRPAVAAATGRLAIGGFDAVHPGLRGLLLDRTRDWSDGAAGISGLLAAAGLTTSAAAYWQLLLGSSLGRGNHLLGLAARPEELVAALGALVHEIVDEAALRAPLRAIVADAFDDGAPAATGTVPTPADAAGLVRDLVGPLVAAYGRDAASAFHRGFVDAARLARIWDRDLAAQLDWADRIPEYLEKAEKIEQHLSNEDIEVDLDTFVESNEETSTTHVHDDHRLVMIESGRMHFWNNVTHRIALEEGDKLLIPTSRLHGSTVLSGECTYHQPIIPDELLQQFP